MRIKWIVLCVLLSTSVTAFAQDSACNADVALALETAGDLCNMLNRNEACYGNFAVEALDFNEQQLDEFVDVGDVVEVFNVQSLRTAPLDDETGAWGIALLSLQADLPDTVPGQNVTIIAFGDTELTTAELVGEAETYDAPLQAFSFSMGVGRPSCTAVPEAGLLIQAPQETNVEFLINNVQVMVGSTTLLRLDELETMTLYNLQGEIGVTSLDKTTVLQVGQKVQVSSVNTPGAPVEFDIVEVRNLPTQLLPDAINVSFEGNWARPDGDGSTETLTITYLEGMRYEVTFADDGASFCTDGVAPLIPVASTSVGTQAGNTLTFDISIVCSNAGGPIFDGVAAVDFNFDDGTLRIDDNAPFTRNE